MEEMEQKKQANTRSYRVTDAVADKIVALGKDLGLNQNDVFETLISAYALQQDAVLVPDAAKDIETFISHLRSIQDAYHNIVSINAQTEERIRQEFQRRLENNDKQISDLIEMREEQKSKIESLEAELADMTKELSAAKQSITDTQNKLLDREKSLEDKQTIIDSLAARLPEQAEIDAKMKAMEDELNHLRASLTASETAKAEAQSRAEKAGADLAVVQKQAELAEKEHKKEISALEKAHAKELETASKQAAAELKSAVAEAKEIEREKASEREEKMQTKIEEYRTKIDELKDQVTELKAAKK